MVWDLPLTAVGRFTEGTPALTLRTGDAAQPLEPSSYDHFRSAPVARRAPPEAEA